jgi:hypothetical protein
MWQTVVQSVLKVFKAEKFDTVVAEDRRRMERIRILLTIVCQSVEHEDPFRIMTDNMNVSGVKFISPVKLVPGEVLILKVLLHSHFPNLSCNGRVVWCDKKVVTGKTMFEGGIEFIGLNSDDQTYLKTFIDRYRVDELAARKSYIA